MIVVGTLCLLTNLAGVGFVFVDQFVTPLSDETKARRASEGDGPLIRNEPFKPGMGRNPDLVTTDTSLVIGMFAFLSLSIPCAAAIWAGFGMLRLRGYWLSVAGSFAIMPAGVLCCMAGLPVGIWSLSILSSPTWPPRSLEIGNLY